jgi:hypothetical protein
MKLLNFKILCRIYGSPYFTPKDSVFGTQRCFNIVVGGRDHCLPHWMQIFVLKLCREHTLLNVIATNYLKDGQTFHFSVSVCISRWRRVFAAVVVRAISFMASAGWCWNNSERNCYVIQVLSWSCALKTYSAVSQLDHISVNSQHSAW